MNACIRIIALISLFGIASTSWAEDEEVENKFYGGIEYGFFDLTQGSASAEPEGFRLRMGARWHKNFGVEAHYGFGANEDSTSVNGTNVNVDIDKYYGLFLRGIFPLGESFNLFGLAGYSNLRVENFSGRLDGNVESRRDSDYSYGVGTDWNFAGNFFASVEYMQMLDTDAFEADVLNVGLRFNF